MDRFQYFHLCNHTFSTSTTDPSIKTITVQNSGDLIDILIERARILDIISVYVAERPVVGPSSDFNYDNLDDQNYEDSDVQDGYFDDDELPLVDYRTYYDQNIPLDASFYSLYLHNRIKWKVKPPFKYTVTAKIQFSAIEETVYDQPDCPRCQGNAWYIDLVNTFNVFQESAGIEYVAQRVVKDLFTEITTNLFDVNYGTTLQRQMFQMNLSDDTLFNHIRAAVADVQSNYLLRQAPILNQLMPNQRLVSLTVGNIQRGSDAVSRILVDLVIRTEQEIQSLRIPLFRGY